MKLKEYRTSIHVLYFIGWEKLISSLCLDIDNIAQSTRLGPRRELDSFPKYGSFFQLQLPKDIHISNTEIGLIRKMKKLRVFLKKSTACKRHIKMILARYTRRLPTCMPVQKSHSGVQDSWLSKKAEAIFCRQK